MIEKKFIITSPFEHQDEKHFFINHLSFHPRIEKELRQQRGTLLFSTLPTRHLSLNFCLDDSLNRIPDLEDLALELRCFVCDDGSRDDGTGHTTGSAQSLL
eukprot:TRINITY_DN4359_c0_g1_i1.p1 TRINITY_DN4359_c0_g1~~TRINITY_DN4359_c0_g1_i1.p1  ORF type:complete len:101 (+),score=14.45 TRINITY_DN4359_c0_g1_i1:13-315(+)